MRLPDDRMSRGFVDAGEGELRRARFGGGEKKSLSGEGELDWKKARLVGKIGELAVRWSSELLCCGWESGTTLGGVCHESDCVLRSGCLPLSDAAHDAILPSGAVSRQGGNGVRSTRSLGVSLTPVHGCTGEATTAFAAAGVSSGLLRVGIWTGVTASSSFNRISRVVASSLLRRIGVRPERGLPSSCNGSDGKDVDTSMILCVE